MFRIVFLTLLFVSSLGCDPADRAPEPGEVPTGNSTVVGEPTELHDYVNRTLMLESQVVDLEERLANLEAYNRKTFDEPEELPVPEKPVKYPDHTNHLVPGTTCKCEKNKAGDCNACRGRCVCGLPKDFGKCPLPTRLKIEAAEKLPAGTRAVPNESFGSRDVLERVARLSGLIKAKVVGDPHDGDTVTLQMSVRLAEIDAPELKQPWGPEARDLLRVQLKQTKTVLLRVEAVDQYGRVVGSLYQDKTDALSQPHRDNVNKIMVGQGGAWHYVEYSKDPEFAAMQEKASLARRGLWSAPAVEAPWDYRRRLKLTR